LFAVGAATAHPYAREALLQKIYNSITTTSNVFGVWWTVGYFEVVDESVRPAKLGQEIGRAENRHIRHRYFAVVDRSGLQLFSTTAAATTIVGANWSSTTNYLVNATATYGGLQYKALQPNTGVVPPSDPTKWTPIQAKVFYNLAPGSANGVPFIIEQGMSLEVNNSLVVSVQSAGVDPGPKYWFTADFAPGSGIGAGAQLICRGNPGTRQAYNPRRDSSVVLYMTMIQ
jgi:hypothetical protein